MDSEDLMRDGDYYYSRPNKVDVRVLVLKKMVTQWGILVVIEIKNQLKSKNKDFFWEKEVK